MSSLLSLGTTIVDGHEAEVRMWESSMDGGDQEKREQQEQEEEKGSQAESKKDQATLLKKFYAKADRTMSAGIRVDLVVSVPTTKRCTYSCLSPTKTIGPRLFQFVLVHFMCSADVQ